MPTLRIHIRSQHGIHAGQITLTLLPEPGQHIWIDSQMNGVFFLGHDETRPRPIDRKISIGISYDGPLKFAFGQGIDTGPIGLTLPLVAR